MVIRVLPAVGVMQRTVPVVSMSPVNMRIGYRKRSVVYRVFKTLARDCEGNR